MPAHDACFLSYFSVFLRHICHFAVRPYFLMRSAWVAELDLGENTLVFISNIGGASKALDRFIVECNRTCFRRKKALDGELAWPGSNGTSVCFCTVRPFS